MPAWTWHAITKADLVRSATRWLKPSVFGLLALPLVWLGYAVWQEAATPGSSLGADPVATVVDYLGIWSIRTLLLALSISPLRRLTGISSLARVRRMVGLFAFAYVSLHLLAFLALILGWDWQALWLEVQDRPYVTLGFAAFSLLSALAFTSTRGWQRRLRHRWQTLHKAVFPAAALAVAHWWWLTRDSYGEVVLYSVVLAALLAERVWVARRGRPPRAAPSLNA